MDAKTLEISECNFKQTVYVYNCRNTVLQIKSKARWPAGVLFGP